MTKSVRSAKSEARERPELLIPEITVTPSVPTPAHWAEGENAAVELAGKFPVPPPRTSSRGVTTTPPEDFNPFEATIQSGASPCAIRQAGGDHYLPVPVETTGYSDPDAPTAVSRRAKMKTHCVPFPDIPCHHTRFAALLARGTSCPAARSLTRAGRSTTSPASALYTAMPPRTGLAARCEGREGSPFVGADRRPERGQPLH